MAVKKNTIVESKKQVKKSARVIGTPDSPRLIVVLDENVRPQNERGLSRIGGRGSGFGPKPRTITIVVRRGGKKKKIIRYVDATIKARRAGSGCGKTAPGLSKGGRGGGFRGIPVPKGLSGNGRGGGLGGNGGKTDD